MRLMTNELAYKIKNQWASLPYKRQRRLFFFRELCLYECQGQIFEELTKTKNKNQRKPKRQPKKRTELSDSSEMDEENISLHDSSDVDYFTDERGTLTCVECETSFQGDFEASIVCNRCGNISHEFCASYDTMCNDCGKNVM